MHSRETASAAGAHALPAGFVARRPLEEWANQESEAPDGLSRVPGARGTGCRTGRPKSSDCRGCSTRGTRVRAARAARRLGYAPAGCPWLGAADRGVEPVVAAPVFPSAAGLLPSVVPFPLPCVCALKSALSKRTTRLRPVSFAT